jgi:hypothetical protein
MATGRPGEHRGDVLRDERKANARKLRRIHAADAAIAQVVEDLSRAPSTTPDHVASVQGRGQAKRGKT